MKLISALGLDYRILLAQLFNFAILIFILWRFAYKPVFNILAERRSKIAKGLKDGEEASKKLIEAEEEKKIFIAEARKEANDIIEEAKGKAELRYQEIVSKAKSDLKIVIDDEKEKIKAERNSAILDVKKEAAKMISIALLKILPEKTDDKSDAKIIAKALEELK